MKDAQRLADAMRAAGISNVEVDGENYVRGDGVAYSRSRAGEAFVSRSSHPKMAEVGKRYAGASVRAWAKRTGFSIVESDGTKLTLKNRRG